MDHLLHLSRHNTRDGARSQIRRGHPGAQRSHTLAIPTPVQPLGSNSFNSLNGSGMSDTTCVVSNNISSRTSTIRPPRHGQSILHCSTWGWRKGPESTLSGRNLPAVSPTPTSLPCACSLLSCDGIVAAIPAVVRLNRVSSLLFLKKSIGVVMRMYLR
jgi:hypothetical protein